MKQHFIGFLLLLSMTKNCIANPLHDEQDTTKKMIDINVSSNIVTKGLNDIEIFDVYQDTLYLINKDKLVEVNIKNGAISSNLKVNLFLANQLKAKVYARQIVVKDNCYYISFLNELYIVSKNGEANKIYVNYYFINDFEVLNNRILVASRDSIKLINNSGRMLACMPFGFTDAGYIKTLGGICYSELSEDSIYDFRESKDDLITINKFAPIVLNKEIEDPFISYASDEYFISFSYKKRDAVYVLKKDDKKNKIIKSFTLKGLNYTPTLQEIQNEEGTPNLKIEYSSGVFYIISLIKNKLKVSSFTL